MFGRDKRKAVDSSQATVGEMMFARAVIEEKNELIDRKDAIIRELVSELRNAESEVKELRDTICEAERNRDTERSAAKQEAFNQLISELVRITADWDNLHRERSSRLSSRIYSLFQDEYGLRLIDEPPESIDPELHQVVEVDHSTSGEASIEILSSGYRIGATVIRPALVKVVLGVRSEHSTRYPSTHAERDGHE